MSTASPDDDNWFEDTINKLFASFFDPTSSTYLPTIITNGYHDASLGIDVAPRNNVPLADHTGIATKHPMPGGCGLGFTDGVAVLAATGSALTDLQTIAPTAGQTITFAQDDSVLQVPLTFATLLINGNLGVTQPCKGIDAAQYSGTYTITCTNVDIIVSITLILGDTLSSTVDKITANVPNLTFKGTLTNAPKNLGLWWSQLVSDPQVIQPFHDTLVDQLTSDNTRNWIQQAINPQLARIPI